MFSRTPSTTNIPIKTIDEQISDLENEIRAFLSDKEKFVFTYDNKVSILNAYKLMYSPTDNKQILGKKDMSKAEINQDTGQPDIFYNPPKYVATSVYNNMVEKLGKIDSEVTTDLNQVSQSPVLYTLFFKDLYKYITDNSYKDAVQLKVGEPIYKLTDDKDKDTYNNYITQLNDLKRHVNGGKRKSRKQRVRNTKHKRRSSKRRSATKKRLLKRRR